MRRRTLRQARIFLAERLNTVQTTTKTTASVEAAPQPEIKLARVYANHHMEEDAKIFEFSYGQLIIGYTADNLHAVNFSDVKIISPDYTVRGGDYRKLTFPDVLHKRCLQMIYATWEQIQEERTKRRNEILGY
jgi:hypothetical protein